MLHRAFSLTHRFAPALALLAVGLACWLLFARPLVADAPAPAVKNVIILIGDGCGFNQMLAADYYQYGAAGLQGYEHFPVRLACSTFAGEGRGYDSGAAWKEFKWVTGGPTDSAAAATALSCGVKTYNKAIGMLGTKPEDAVRVQHILEDAEGLGKSTGVVTSVEFSHATPAGFVAHNVNRDAYHEIAEEMVNASATDVIMGCGHPAFDHNGARLDKPKYSFIGEKTWQGIAGGTAGAAVDADHNGRADDAWTVLQDRAAFQALQTAANPPKRVLGVAPVLTTLQQARSAGNPKNDLPYVTPFTESVPTLAEMTTGALNVLGRNPRGFVVMIEGGAIDWASHANQSGRLIEETVAFNRAIEAAVNWITRNGGWKDTLLVVTADHETGYLTGPQADAAQPTWSAVANNGQGALPGMGWNSGGHTNSLVPFYAMGQGSGGFLTRATHRDLLRGAYLDNTDLPRVIRTLLR